MGYFSNIGITNFVFLGFGNLEGVYLQPINESSLREAQRSGNLFTKSNLLEKQCQQLLAYTVLLSIAAEKESAFISIRFRIQRQQFFWRNEYKEL